MKKSISFLALLMSAGLLFGCNSEKLSENAEQGTKNEVISKEDSESNEQENSKEESTKEETKEEVTKEETPKEDEESTTELTLYMVDINKETPEFIQKKISLNDGEKVNSVLIVDEVVKSLELPIQIDSVSDQDDAVIVSFKKDSPPVVGVGTAGEVEILDSIAKSLIENVEGVNKVFYRVEGGIFESGHTVLELDEPYEILTK